MSTTADKGGGNGHGAEVERHRVAAVQLELDMENGQLTIGGACPNTELAKAICQMAADGIERKIAARDAQSRIDIVGAEMLGSLRR